MLFWPRPNGRVSYYLVTIKDNDRGKLVIKQTRTNEQFIVLPNELRGKVFVTVRFLSLSLSINITSLE